MIYFGGTSLSPGVMGYREVGFEIGQRDLEK